MSEPFIAEIRIFAGTFAPRGWAFCSGQLLPISQNTALFALLGTMYGGDGVTTLGLPNLQGRAPMHPGQGPGLSSRQLGEFGGTSSVALTEATMPAHTHQLRGSTGDADSTHPEGHYYGDTSAMFRPPNENLRPMADGALAEAGASQAHNNLQPYLVVNFIIALIGLFPSRA